MFILKQQLIHNQRTRSLDILVFIIINPILNSKYRFNGDHNIVIISPPVIHEYDHLIVIVDAL